MSWSCETMKIYRAGWHFKFPSWCDQWSITRRSCPVSPPCWFEEEDLKKRCCSLIWRREHLCRGEEELGHRYNPQSLIGPGKLFGVFFGIEMPYNSQNKARVNPSLINHQETLSSSVLAATPSLYRCLSSGAWFKLPCIDFSAFHICF